MAATDEISAPDDTSIRFRLKSRSRCCRDALGKTAAYHCAIMPSGWPDRPYTQVTEMVGSGPSRFVANERVPARWRSMNARPATCRAPAARPAAPRARRSRISIASSGRIIPDPATAAAALQAGEIDWWQTPRCRSAAAAQEPGR